MDVSYSLPKVSDQLLVLKKKVHNRVQPTQLIEEKMTKNFKTPMNGSIEKGLIIKNGEITLKLFSSKTFFWRTPVTMTGK